MQVNAIIGAEDMTGKTINTTITYLRPSQKSQAPALAIALNALTTNNYEGVKVNEINVDIEGKTEPTLNVINAWNTGADYAYTQVEYTGNGQLFVQCTAPASIDQTKRLFVQSSGSFTGTVYATETDAYSSKTATFSFNR